MSVFPDEEVDLLNTFNSAYTVKILRVDLTKGKISKELIDEETLRNYVGGTCLGIKLLYDEVPSGVEWSAPENCLFLGSGPLGGTVIGGSGAVALVTKGALTNGATTTQANGFFGAYLRFSGFDGILIKGASSKWVYLYIHNGVAELKDAEHLIGQDTYETEESIGRELGCKSSEVSVLSIGPAGENLVRFAAVGVDRGHIAGHNGVGAVMGSKKLKAIAAARSQSQIPIYDRPSLSAIAKEARQAVRDNRFYNDIATWGTLNSYIGGSRIGMLPVENYTTSIFDIDEERLAKYDGEHIRGLGDTKRHQCWACQWHHNDIITIAEGPYAGRVVGEPEYEGLAAWSSLTGVKDMVDSVVIADEVDRLGMDTNEAGWVIAWLIECYEKGILTTRDTDGLNVSWGDTEKIINALHSIAHRKGFGNVLAEGVLRASRHVGGMATDIAVCTMKGNTPRGHDHRSFNWFELFDTCVSNCGTIETHFMIPREMVGLPQHLDLFDPEAVSTAVAKTKGIMQFEDSMVTCRFNTRSDLMLLCRAVNAVTGWDITVDGAITVGRRAVNLTRLFNLRNGIDSALDAPSVRYGSTPSDGPLQGKSIMPHWEHMLRNYYRLMGWDEKTGVPLQETLEKLGITHPASNSQ